MDEMEYIRQLEERIEKLEKFIDSITVGEGKDIFLNNCPISDIYVSEGCNMSFDNCPIGSVFPNDIDDAEGRIDDLEDRLQDIIFQIDEAKS
jgi:hypothetical protein